MVVNRGAGNIWFRPKDRTFLFLNCQDNSIHSSNEDFHLIFSNLNIHNFTELFKNDKIKCHFWFSNKKEMQNFYWTLKINFPL
jgi:hypothetical protein